MTLQEAAKQGIARVRLYWVTETELDTIAALSNSIHFGFFGISFGSLVSFGITLKTVQISDPISHAAFVALIWASALASVYFAARAVRDYLASSRKLKDLKGQR